MFRNRCFSKWDESRTEINWHIDLPRFLIVTLSKNNNLAFFYYLIYIWWLVFKEMSQELSFLLNIVLITWNKYTEYTEFKPSQYRDILWLGLSKGLSTSVTVSWVTLPEEHDIDVRVQQKDFSQKGRLF